VEPRGAVIRGGALAGTAVERQDSRGVFDEILSLRDGLTLPDRLPLLDSHNRESVDRVIGSVTDLRLVDGELRGRVALSRHNEQARRIAAEIGDGAVFGLSIGYRVARWQERTNPETRRRERIAVAWTPLEASLVAIPADPQAGMRSIMDPEVKDAPAERTGREIATRPAGAPAAGTRAATDAAIRSIGAVAGLDQEWIDEQIERGATVDGARAAAFEAMTARAAPAAGIRNTAPRQALEDPAFRVRAMGEGLYARINPHHNPSEPARAFVGHTATDVARECLRAAGISTTGLSQAALIERALHTVSDFPLILADTANRVLRDSYRAVPSALRPLARRATARDFRARHSIALTGGLKLERVNEHGEFKAGTLHETGESYRVETFGRTFGITRQALVNDELGAFNDVPRIMGVAAANFESDFLAGLVSGNPTMADGKAVFHADHGNVPTANGPITLAALTAARIAMRRQKNGAGDLVGVAPRFLVVAPEQETAAEQAVAEIAAADPANVNPFSKLIVVVEPRLPSGAWYLAADPAVIPALEYAYHEGEEGPQIISQAGFDVDGVRFRVRLDFGGGWIDWRGWYRNGGAA
jgi:HK97 family phage prohead protease